MIKVEVTNLKNNKVGWGGTFETQALATAWISKCEENFLWGKPERTLQEDNFGSVLDIDGTVADLSKAISTGTVTEEDKTFKTYTFASEYSVAQSDITEEVTAAADLLTEEVAVDKGKKLFTKMRKKTKKKSLNTAQMTNMVQLYRQIRDCLELCGPEIAITYVTNVTANTNYFPDDNRAAVIEVLTKMI